MAQEVSLTPSREAMASAATVLTPSWSSAPLSARPPCGSHRRHQEGLPRAWRFSPRLPRSQGDPDSPSGRSPQRVLWVGFWSVTTIAVCMRRATGAVSSFREGGLPCGLRGTLCTLPLCRSACTSFTAATLGRSGWLDLTPQGLPPCKKRQASLGALTPRAHLLPEAGATQERTLEAVRCSALFG